MQLAPTQPWIPSRAHFLTNSFVNRQKIPTLGSPNSNPTLTQHHNTNIGTGTFSNGNTRGDKERGKFATNTFHIDQTQSTVNAKQ